MKIFQPIVSGSFTTSGSVFLKGLTSAAQSNVVIIDTGSGQLYVTASSAIGGGGSGAGFPYTGDAVISGSLLVSGSGITVTGSINASSITGSLFGTASWANNVITAQTASYATNFTVAQTLSINGTLTDSATINSTIVGGNNLFQQATGSFTSAHGKYTLYKGVNARAGEFITVWNGTNVTYYDNSTTDIGLTSDITFQSAIVSSQLQINAVAASSGWTIKMLVTYL